jgi:excisionase family DNA binding protein
MSNLDYRDPEWVAEKLGLERNTVYKYLQEGIIPAVRFGRKWLISERRLCEWLEEETKKQTKQRRENSDSTERLAKRMDNYSAESKKTIKTAHTEARRYGHDKLGEEHLLLAMAEDNESDEGKMIKRSMSKNKNFRACFEKCHPATDAETPRRLARSDSAKKAIKKATEEAANAGRAQITPHDILLGILQTKNLLDKYGIDADKLRREINKKGEKQ